MHLKKKKLDIESQLHKRKAKINQPPGSPTYINYAIFLKKLVPLIPYSQAAYQDKSTNPYFSHL